MAVVAKGSKFSRTNTLIVIVICIGAGAYCMYDGWVSKTYQQKHMLDEDGNPDLVNGKPDANLMFNRYYGPIGCGVIALYSLISLVRISRRGIVADDSGLAIDGGATIPYGSIEKIDKRYFDKDGYFFLEYGDGGATRKVKLTDRKYDSLGQLLDEVVKRTGAAPADAESDQQQS